jgi:terminase small subunit-like protein
MSKKADPAPETIEAIRTGLPPGVELDEREEAILDLAARQARDVHAAEADIATRGYLVEGSRGQEVLNPSLAEVRQSRLALGKLLGQLDLPESTRDALRGARHAAEARWGKAS